jgi:hypothetical protein
MTDRSDITTPNPRNHKKTTSLDQDGRQTSTQLNTISCSIKQRQGITFEMPAQQQTVEQQLPAPETMSSDANAVEFQQPVSNITTLLQKIIATAHKVSETFSNDEHLR